MKLILAIVFALWIFITDTVPMKETRVLWAIRVLSSIGLAILALNELLT